MTGFNRQSASNSRRLWSPGNGGTLFRPAARYLARLLLAAFLLGWILPDGLWADGELVRALDSREKFLASAERQTSRVNWLALIQELEEAAQVQLQARHASRGRYLASDLALQSALIFKQGEDYERAESLARRAVQDCPRCAHAPAAQLVLGRALLGRGLLDQAYSQLMKIELNYPGSPEVGEARKLLAGLKGGPTPTPEGGPGPAPPPPVEKPPEKVEKALVQPKSPPAPPRLRTDGRAQAYFLTMEEQAERTIITVYLDKSVSFVHNLIPPAREGGSFRAYADLRGCVLTPKMATQLKEKTALVNLVKLGQFQSDVVRLVADLPQKLPYRPFFQNDPPRLIFQVARKAENLSPLPTFQGTAEPVKPKPDPPKPAADPPKPDPLPQAYAPKSLPTDSLARQLGLKARCLVLDPGHGGKDTGAAASGLLEKSLALKLARKIKERLEKSTDLKVYLTRETDEFITLDRRTVIAKEKKADIFISIHANAHSAASVEGYETYILNFTQDKSAEAVAARENASANKSISEMNDLLEQIAKNSKVAESSYLARLVHRQTVKTLSAKHKIKDLGVKEAPFIVLLGVEVPAILVEVGFLTNKAEAARLSQEAYLDLLADGIAQGLAEYAGGL